MFCKEECVEFENNDNLLLRGILHHGNKAEYKKISLICLNTGLNDMVGWHRLQIKVARFLANNGYNVLRFDNCGIGDSEGNIDECGVLELFADIESGLWITDAIASVDFMQNKFDDKGCLFLGYCGGALTSIHAAAQDKRISGVIDVAGPVTLSTTDKLNRKDPWTVKQNIKSYKRKIINLTSIKKFITGQSDYKDIYESIVHYLRHKVKGRYNQREKNRNEDVIDIDNLNYSFFNAFENFVKIKRPVLFYYAELDKATWGFKRYFLSKYFNKPIWKDTGCTFVELEKANHIFSDQESQDRIKSDIYSWLKINYP